MSTLPYDVARCCNGECIYRHDCRRFLELDSARPHTPVFMHEGAGHDCRDHMPVSMNKKENSDV